MCESDDVLLKLAYEEEAAEGDEACEDDCEELCSEFEELEIEVAFGIDPACSCVGLVARATSGSNDELARFWGVLVGGSDRVSELE